MSTHGAIEVVDAFLAAINSADLDRLCALLSVDHQFFDGLGNRIQGREAMRKAWRGYFEWFPDYRVSVEETFSRGDSVALFGRAEGTYSAGGQPRKKNHWVVPAAWKAIVRDGLIAEWRVYADNQPARALLRAANP